MLPDDYECDGQMNIEECMQCAGCANEGTEYCTVCEDGDMHMTPDEKEYTEWMCDLLCGGMNGEAD